MTHPDPAWLDRMYNNRARVPESAEHLARWTRESADARATTPGICDLRYGHTPSETLDVFAGPSADAPVLFFIHGGWWRSLDKSDHSFVAPPFVARGVCVVLPNYALCPGTEAAPVTIPDIALQMVRALAWTWRISLRSCTPEIDSALRTRSTGRSGATACQSQASSIAAR